MAGALSGLTVVEISSGPAAALAGMFLADHGAAVTRLMAPGDPDFRDGGFVVWDRGKRTVRVDLDAADGRAAVQRLLAAADILIEDFAPSDPRQGLIKWAELKAQNPRLIACSITAYGKKGSWRDEPPIDDLVMARTGLLGGMPGFRPPPVHVVHPLPSVGAALLACNGIAAALLARETSGRGRAVETSLMAGALLYMTKADGKKIKRHVFQTHPSGSAPFYSLYECADGNWVQLGCVHEGFIAIAAGLFGLTDLINEPRMVSGRAPLTPADDAEMRDKVAAAIKTRPLAEWSKLFEEADVPFAPARLAHESFDDPQVRHNKMVMELADPVVGPAVQMGVPVELSATPGSIQGPRTPPINITDLAGAHAPAPTTASPAAAAMDPPPLDGVRVLEITNLIAGPTAGRILADLGANVIKLEPPAGDISRPIGRTYFYALNFNKRSVCVDTSKDEGRRMVQAIAATCDVLLANMRPGASARMGIGTAHNPRMIECHLTGYGFTGPYAKRPGIDPLAQAYMGLSRAQGGPENPPVFPAQLAPTDYTNGAMGAFGTILALYHRARTGVAQTVNGNLLSAGIVLSSAWFTRWKDRPERPLADKDQMGLSPFHRLFKLSDGWIYVVAGNDAQRRAVCAIAGIAPLDPANRDTIPGHHPNDAPFAHTLAEAFAGKRVADVLPALAENGVPATEAPEGHAEIFLESEHASANDLVAVREHPVVGRLRVQWRSVQFSDTKPTLGRVTPLLGEHTEEALVEAGVAPREIAALVDAGVLKSAKAT
ncbi:MAG: CoA transferase [Hyphomicrobiaceae bacterium]